MRKLELPETNTCWVDVLDAWKMTSETVLTGVNGKVNLKLPGDLAKALLRRSVI